MIDHINNYEDDQLEVIINLRLNIIKKLYFYSYLVIKGLKYWKKHINES